MSKFALIGASGYIAPRHVEAIKHTNNELVALLDPYDGIGYIDRHYPNASYFKESERFDRHLDRLRRKNEGVDYVSICSPNYLHDSHIRLAFQIPMLGASWRHLRGRLKVTAREYIL